MLFTSPSRRMRDGTNAAPSLLTIQAAHLSVLFGGFFKCTPGCLQTRHSGTSTQAARSHHSVLYGLSIQNLPGERNSNGSRHTRLMRVRADCALPERCPVLVGGQVGIHQRRRTCVCCACVRIRRAAPLASEDSCLHIKPSMPWPGVFGGHQGL